MKPILKADSVIDYPAEKEAVLSRASSAPLWVAQPKIRPAALVLAKHSHGNVLF